MLFVKGLLQDAPEVKTVMSIGKSDPVPYHLWSEKLLFAGIVDVVRFGKVYPRITDMNAQAISENDEEQRDEQIGQPMRTLDGQFHMLGEKSTRLDRIRPCEQSQPGSYR